MDIITEVISTITAWLTGFWTLVSDSIESAIGIFYDSTDGLTVIGVLALFGLAVGLVYLGLNFVRRLITK